MKTDDAPRHVEENIKNALTFFDAPDVVSAEVVQITDLTLSGPWMVLFSDDVNMGHGDWVIDQVYDDQFRAKERIDWWNERFPGLDTKIMSCAEYEEWRDNRV